MSAWRDRSVFVSGATGLLGSHLTAALVREGADVVVLERDTVRSSQFDRLGLRERVAVVRGRVDDLEVVERALGEYEVSTVFHLAAQTIVGIAARNPLSTWESNVRGTYLLLEACRRSPRVERIVVASSDKAYGAATTLPYREDARLEGRAPYDASKSCADLIAASYAATFRMPVTITRCGNLFGPGDLNWSRIVPGTMRAALRGERPIIRSDGSPLRDYLYVEDAVDAYLALAGAAPGAVSGEAFNVSYGEPLRADAMARLALAAIGRGDLDLDVRGDAVGEIPEQFLSAEKLRGALGWTPRVGTEEGLRRTAEWYRALLASSAA